MLIKVEDLDYEIKHMFLSSQLERIGYNSLSNDDKEAVLNRANIEMNRLQWIGEKVTPEQPDSWPRIIDEKIVETPDRVYTAMAQYSYDYIRLMNNDTYDNLRMGITSSKVGPISESYDISKADLNINKNYMKYLVGLIYRGRSLYGYK